MHDYYAILNIDSNASKQDIKKAFKKEALKWHPDRNKSQGATERMQLINESYLILKDADARLRYDKEYQRYSDFKKEQTPRQEYNIHDDILKDWMKKAKAQAKDMVKMSIDDLFGMSKVAFSASWEKTKYYILALVVLNIIFMALN